MAWAKAVAGGGPELQRLLTVCVGTMCVVDLSHAAVTSWGSWGRFFSGLSVAAWARLGLQGRRELEELAAREDRNILALGEEISEEWDALLERSRSLLEEKAPPQPKSPV